MPTNDVSPADIREPHRKHVASVRALIETVRDEPKADASTSAERAIVLLNHAEEMVEAMKADGTLDEERPRSQLEKEVWFRLILEAVMQILRGILEGSAGSRPAAQPAGDDTTRPDQQ